MLVISENKLVFRDMERMLHALYDGKPEYDNSVVVLGYNVAKYLPEQVRREHPGRRIIVYQLEQLFDGSKWANAHAYSWLKGVDEIWEYDLSNMAWLKANGFSPKYVPLSYCEALKEIQPTEKDIDVLFYGYPTPRRLRVMGQWMGISWNTYTTIWGTGLTGDVLKSTIARSKIILNVHAFEKDCRQEQVRIFYPVINGCCVVSEKSPHNEFGKAIVESRLDKIPGVLSHILRNNIWSRVAKDAPEVYRKHCEGRT